MSIHKILTILAALGLWAALAAGADRVQVGATGQAPADLPNARQAAIEDAPWKPAGAWRWPRSARRGTSS